MACLLSAIAFEISIGYIIHAGQDLFAKMAIDRKCFQEGFFPGIYRGWKGFIWALKILVPVSFLTAFLNWSGALQQLDSFIQPLMRYLGLPGMAALPLLIGFVAGIYSGVAALVILPFSQAQMTLAAIYMMMAHNLIQETVIQAQSGLRPFKAIFFRLAAASITVMICAHFFDATPAAPEMPAISAPISRSFGSMLGAWGLSTLDLLGRIFLIMMVLLTLLEILKTSGWIDRLVRMLTPILKCLGLSQKVGILWIAGAIFGLVYSSAVIVEEANQKSLSKVELEGLQLSIGIHHSIIEDPAIFISLGLSPFWMVVPRLIAAMVFVRVFSLWHRMKTA
jgi:hypothetical protein